MVCAWMVLSEVTVATLIIAVAFGSPPPSSQRDDDAELYLTPMIRDGRLTEARAACKVTLDNVTGVDSCSGYLTVDDTHGSNLFFWFFPVTSGAPNAPVLLWLQGGPGASSLYSVFNEHGPFSVDKSGVLQPRRHTWTSTHSVLYVDNPVGTGYSFTSDDAGYSGNQTAVGQNLYSALVQFFTLFPEYRDNEFYVAGESYAGKYVPAVSYTIHQKNPEAPVKINLKGLAIGNGLIDPANQMVYSEYLYQYGLIDENGKHKFEELENLTRELIAAGDFTEAYYAMTEIMISSPSLYRNLTRMPTIYNAVWNSNPIPFEYHHWDKYVKEPRTRAALHVGRRAWSAVDQVYERLKYDIPRSVAPWLATLLEAGQYRVLLYSGQLDVIVPYRGTMNVANSLRWSGAGRFRNATRTIWLVSCRCDGTDSAGHRRRHCSMDCRCGETDVAGYATASGPLTVLMVRNAGHMVPYDQPAWAHDLIDRFTSGEPYE